MAQINEAAIMFFAHIEMKSGETYDILTVIQHNRIYRCNTSFSIDAPVKNPPTGGSMLQLQKEIDLTGGKVWLEASASESHDSFDDLVELTDVPVPVEKTPWWKNPIKRAGEEIKEGWEWCKANPDHVRNFVIGCGMAVVGGLIIIATGGTATPVLVGAAGWALGGSYASYKAVQQDVAMGDARPWTDMLKVSYSGSKTGAQQAYFFFYGRRFVKSPKSFGVFNAINGLFSRKMDTAWDRTLDTGWKRFSHIWNPGKIYKDYKFGQWFSILGTKFNQAANKWMNKAGQAFSKWFGGKGSQLVPNGPSGMVPYGQGGTSPIVPYFDPFKNPFALPPGGGNNFSYADGYDTHMIYGNGTVNTGRSRPGINGAHNEQEFMQQLNGNGGRVINTTEHPTVNGISQIEYEVYSPSMNNGQGGYRSVYTPKTVYDPEIISDQQMIDWGKEAMENGQVKDDKVYGEASNGLNFTGYYDEATGEITNFYPTLPEK